MAKNKENNQELMMTKTCPSYPKMSKSGRDGNQKAIFVAEQESNDQPIPEVDNDQSEIDPDDYEWFLDMDFIKKLLCMLFLLVLSILMNRQRGRFLKEPTMTLSLMMINSMVERGRLPSHGEKNNAEIGISSAPSHSKKIKLTVNMKELAKNLKMTTKEVREFKLEHNASVRTRKE